MNSSPDAPIALNTAESWEAAKKIAATIGPIPSSFTSSIRTLRSNYEQNRRDNTGGMSSGARFLVTRICRSTSMSAPIYYLARTFREDQLPAPGALTPKSLVSLFGPDDLASALGIIYLLRRVKKKTPDDIWSGLTEPLSKLSEIGGFLGNAIKSLGFADGLLLGSLQHLGLALLLSVDEKKTREFKRRTKTHPLHFDLQVAASIWGCTHAQVSSVLIQAAGFGVDLSSGFNSGITARDTDAVKDDVRSLRIKTMDLWLHALFTTGKVPNLPSHRGEYYPLKQDLDLLLSKVNRVRSGDTDDTWLLRGKEDLDAGSFPGLCIEDTETPAEAAEAGEVPEKLEEITEE